MIVVGKLKGLAHLSFLLSLSPQHLPRARVQTFYFRTQLFRRIILPPCRVHDKLWSKDPSQSPFDASHPGLQQRLSYWGNVKMHGSPHAKA